MQTILRSERITSMKTLVHNLQKPFSKWLNVLNTIVKCQILQNITENKEMSINKKRNKSHTMRYSSSRLRLMSEWSDSYLMAYIEWKWGAAPIYQPQLQQQHIIRVHTD